MSMCSPDDVRIHSNPSCITDLEISTIITSSENYIKRKAKSTDSTNADLIEAVIHHAAAIVLKRAHLKGEYANSIETPGSKITFDVNKQIQIQESERDYFLAQYSVSNPSYSSPSYHSGFDCTHGGR